MNDNNKKYSAIHYANYLQIEKLLDCQAPRSKELGVEAHDEMLFIIVHQVYELWFKQIIYELRDVHHIFSQTSIRERDVAVAVHRIDRINHIFKLLIDQIKVIETMTPLDFLDFRNYLFPASGFQSFQFREMEVLLGLKSAYRHTYNNTPYAEVFDANKKAILEQLENGKSFHDLIQSWLERIPFINLDGFSFLEEYKNAVTRMLEKEKEAILSTDILSDTYKTMRLKMLGDTDSYFSNIWDENKHNEMMKEGTVRFSYKATVAALFINLYRDEPILHMPFKLLGNLMDMDEMITTWRYRHAQMVLRMLGRKIGTGGSSGHEYLAKTAERHHIFGDLHNISTLLIPRSELPELPPHVKKNLLFHFTVETGRF